MDAVGTKSFFLFFNCIHIALHDCYISGNGMMNLLGLPHEMQMLIGSILHYSKCNIQQEKDKSAWRIFIH